MVRKKIKSGLYNNVSEGIREALRNSLKQEAENEWLKRAALGFAQLEAGRRFVAVEEGVHESGARGFVNLEFTRLRLATWDPTVRWRLGAGNRSFTWTISEKVRGYLDDSSRWRASERPVPRLPGRITGQACHPV